MNPEPYRLTPSFREKIWGVHDLEPWFRPAPEKIGEVWYLNPQPEPLPILVKLIFTSALLSVQVHPDDAYARSHRDVSGKTEMWYILSAEPGARLAMGFRERVTRERVREAALSGEIESLLQWFPVSAGQIYFISPGTVHALGPGIRLCEIQQQADITYRLYDYGRGRELHLDKALDVADLGPHPGPLDRRSGLLASCGYFATERLELDSPIQYQADPDRFHLLIFAAGNGTIGNQPFTGGEVWMIPAGARPFPLRAESASWCLRSYVPAP